MQTRGKEGIQNPENFADVLYEWSFKDILEMSDVKILVVSGSGATSRLAASAPGTAKHEVYETMIDGNDEVWYPTTKDALEMVISEPNHYLYRETLIIFGEKTCI